MGILTQPHDGEMAVKADWGARPILFTVHDGIFTFKKKEDGEWYPVSLSLEQLQALASRERYRVQCGRGT